MKQWKWSPVLAAVAAVLAASLAATFLYQGHLSQARHVTLDELERRATAAGLEVRRHGPPEERYSRMTVVDRAENPAGAINRNQRGSLTIVDMGTAGRASYFACGDPAECWAIGALWLQGDRAVAERLFGP